MDGAKSTLRSATRAARRALSPAERTDASSRIVERLLGLPEILGAGTLLAYAALTEEVDLGELLAERQARDVRILLPRVRGDELDLVTARSTGSLVVGHRGVREPTGPRVDPVVVEVALVPGLAFDPRGGRLGSGGGHYDRLLAQLPAGSTRIGVAFACQLVPHVPREDHDVEVDLVVTETGIYRAER